MFNPSSPSYLSTLASLLALSITGLAGCITDEVHSEGPGCTETITVLGLEELSPEFENQGSSTAFSGAQLLSQVLGSYQESISWSDTGLGDITIEVTHLDGEVRFHDLEIDASSGPDGYADLAAPICDDRVEVDVQVSVSSADGRLNESWVVALSSTDGESGEVNIDELQPASLQGSYDFITVDPASYDEISASFSARFRDGLSFGTINELASVSVGSGPEAIVSVSINEVASWPSNTEQP